MKKTGLFVWRGASLLKILDPYLQANARLLRKYVRALLSRLIPPPLQGEKARKRGEYQFLQRHDSYALTLTLSHTWERGAVLIETGFSCSSSLRFRILDLDPDACTGSREFNGTGMMSGGCLICS